MAELSATIKSRAGKGSARSLRRQGRVPAIVYGGEAEPQMITLDPIALFKQYAQVGFFARPLTLDVEGKSVQVLPRAVQLDKVKDQPIHADFLRIEQDTSVRVEVPVIFVNHMASNGIKRGAVLNVVRKAVEVTCLAKDIPERFEADLTGLNVNDAVKYSHLLDVPASVTPTIRDRDFVIATITAPSALKRQAMEEARAARQEGGEVSEEEE